MEDKSWRRNGEEKSWRRNHGREIMKETCRRDDGAEFMEEHSWRSTHEGEIMEEKSRRRIPPEVFPPSPLVSRINS